MPTLKANIAGVWTPIGYAPPGRFTATADGVVPLSGGGTVNFLRADGTWAPATGTGNFVAKTGDTMTGALTIDMGNSVTGRGLILANSGNANEGGELELAGAGSYGAIQFDNYQGMLRFLMGGQVPFLIAASGSPVNVGVGITNFKMQVGGPGAATLQVGDDAYFVDTNMTNGLALRGINSGGANGVLAFGNNNGRWVGNDGGGSVCLKTNDGGIYIAGQTINFQNVAGTSLFRHDGSNFALDTGRIYFGSNGDIGPNGGELRIATAGGTSIITMTANDLYLLNRAGNEWRMQITGARTYLSKRIEMDVVGYTFIHPGDTDTGLYYVGDGDIALVSNGQIVAETYAAQVLSVPSVARIRLYAKSDSNHELQYFNGTPTGSGEASNGPKLNGYSSVQLHQQINDKSLFLSSNGNVFINAGSQYLNFSSREFKHNIKALDPERALLMVERWRPVEYDWNEDLNTPHSHGYGFIAEDHADVLPEMCHIYGESIDGPENERVVIHRPGWAAAIDYANGVPWLAGAIQALLLRIENLETRMEQAA